MNRLASFMLASCIFLVALTGCVDTCARIVDIKTDSYMCHAFSSNETKQAKKDYGVTLGAPLSDALSTLIKNGWQIDKPRLLLEYGETEERKVSEPGMICGSGYMAVCTMFLMKQGKSIAIDIADGGNEEPRVIGIGPPG